MEQNKMDFCMHCRRLTTDEMAALDSTSSRSGADFFGAPFETW